jgi:hypothetical protein
MAPLQAEGATPPLLSPRSAAPCRPAYRSAAGKAAIFALYDKALAELPHPYEERLVETSRGTAHVLVCGPQEVRPR